MSDSSTVSVAQWLDPSSDVASVALQSDPAVADDLARELRGENFVVQVVRGENMRTTAQVFDEFAAASPVSVPLRTKTKTLSTMSCAISTTSSDSAPDM